MIRPQYHFRDSPDGLRAWNVARLIRLSRGLPVIRLPLEELSELDEAYWGDQPMSVRKLVGHLSLIQSADMSYPVILCARGRIMDGMHRVARACLEDLPTVSAVQFRKTPPPDFVGVSPDDLPYDPSAFEI